MPKSSPESQLDANPDAEKVPDSGGEDISEDFKLAADAVLGVLFIPFLVGVAGALYYLCSFLGIEWLPARFAQPAVELIALVLFVAILACVAWFVGRRTRE